MILFADKRLARVEMQPVFAVDPKFYRPSHRFHCKKRLRFALNLKTTFGSPVNLKNIEGPGIIRWGFCLLVVEQQPLAPEVCEYVSTLTICELYVWRA